MSLLMNVAIKDVMGMRRGRRGNKAVVYHKEPDKRSVLMLVIGGPVNASACQAYMCLLFAGVLCFVSAFLLAVKKKGSYGESMTSTENTKADHLYQLYRPYR